MAGKLFLVATPIGNLEDITLRAINTLKEVDLIACEDTRHSKILLDNYDIKTRTTSYHEHNKYEKADELVLFMQRGNTVAVITDAGTPGISDPGEELVRRALEAGIEVTSLPGPSAVITALSMCGLSSRRFVFEGFLDVDKSKRRLALERIKYEQRTIVIYEAPHKIKRTLADLKETLGGARRIRILRELTKKFEELMAFTIDEAIEYFEQNDPKGEMVVVIEGLGDEEAKEIKAKEWEGLSVEEHVERLMKEGLSEKDAMKKAAALRGVSKRDIYAEIKKN